jgi:hypothetical protein
VVEPSNEEPVSEQSSENGQAARKTRLSQDEVPAYSLEQALRVPRAIAENYAYTATRPMNVASAMSLSPSSSGFRMITGAAVAYGLTTGAAKAPEIGLTPLGMRIVRPTSEGEDLVAMREALLRPKVIGEFLRKYDGAPIPPDNIAVNVLQEMNVPADRAASVLTLIVNGADSVGFLKNIGGRRYVDLTGVNTPSTSQEVEPVDVDGSPVVSPGEVPVPEVSGGLTRFQPSVAGVTVTPGVHINIEIHIAADASSETVQDIFKNMRRYVLNAEEKDKNS